MLNYITHRKSQLLERAIVNLKKIVFYSVEDLVLIEKNAFKGIAKNAVFTIYADRNTFAEAKEMIRGAGAPKKVKYKRATI